jgi:hypothetical protein
MIDSTGEVFLSVLGEVFDAEVTGKGELRGGCNTCTWREPSLSFVVSDTGAAKVVKERGHLVILWSAMIRLSKCEELTTYETREVVAVPNSRSRGGCLSTVYEIGQEDGEVGGEDDNLKHQRKC